MGRGRTERDPVRGLVALGVAVGGTAIALDSVRATFVTGLAVAALLAPFIATWRRHGEVGFAVRVEAGALLGGGFGTLVGGQGALIGTQVANTLQDPPIDDRTPWGTIALAVAYGGVVLAWCVVAGRAAFQSGEREAWSAKWTAGALGAGLVAGAAFVVWTAMFDAWE